MEATKQSRCRHSGMVRRTRPGISRFRVRCFASPRNDGVCFNSKHDFQFQTHVHALAAQCARGVDESSAQRGRGERRVPVAPAASRALGSGRTHTSKRVHRNHPDVPARNGFNGLLRALVSEKSARICERAVLTNRPSLGLSPFVLEGQEPAGERGTDPVSSSTRTVAWA